MNSRERAWDDIHSWLPEGWRGLTADELEAVLGGFPG